MTVWKLEHPAEGVLTDGTEAEVKAAAQALITSRGSSPAAEAHLREALFLTKPDGTHQGQAYGDGTFEPGEPITWIDVDW